MPPSPLLQSDADPPQVRVGPWPALGRLSLITLLSAWSLLLLAWLTLYWGILPNARAWLPQIESAASAALGAPLRIGDIEVRTGGWMPVLELGNVVLLDRERREVLRLPRVSAVPSLSSLTAFELRLQQLLIDGADLEIRRDPLGAVHVAGFDVTAGGGGDDALVDWLWRQHEVVVRRGRVRWIDERLLAPPLELEGVDIVLRRGLRRRDVRLDATPPQAWGDRFTLRGRFAAPLLGRGGAWRDLRGTLFADLPRVDVAQLRRHVPLPFELHAGDGALRAWVDLDRGDVRATTLDLALRDVALRLAPVLAPLELQQVHGRIDLRRDAGGFSVAADDLGFVAGDGRVWPPGDLHLALRRGGGANAPFSGGEFSADRLDLALMAAVAERLPLGAAVRGLLADAQPGGIVEALQARWDGPIDAPLHYRVQARLHELSLAAHPASRRDAAGRPGWRGAAVEIDADDGGGRARLTFDGGALTLPGVLGEPEVALDTFDARLDWRIVPGEAGGARSVELHVADAHFANADLRGGFEARWRADAQAGVLVPGPIELRGRIDDMRADALHRYLPLSLPASMRDYARRALSGGRIGAARFEVAGDLRSQPLWSAADGALRIAGQVEGLTLAYVPDEPGWTSPWPAFTDVAGRIEIDRSSFQVREGTARVFGIELKGMSVAIADMDAPDPLLQVEGTASGPAADLLHFVGTTPVGGWIGDALAHASIEGRGQLGVALRIALAAPERSAVNGWLQLAGNDVRVAPQWPLLAGARGRVDFSGDGFMLQGVSARVFGGEAAIEGGQRPDGHLQLVARGQLDAQGLRGAPELASVAGAAAALVQRVDGQATYRLQVDRPAGSRPLLDFTSDLVGVAVDLPEPFGKRADTALPLRWRTQAVADGTQGEDDRDELTVSLGELLQARYLRRHRSERIEVIEGGVGIGQPAPAPAADVVALATLHQVDVDAWRAVAAAAGAGAGGPGDYLPRRVGLRADELRAGDQRLTNLVAGISYAPADERWRATASADQLSGYAEWAPGAGAAPGAVLARFARWTLPGAGPAPAAAATPSVTAPARMPALDVDVGELDIGGKPLGRLELRARHESPPWGGLPVWTLTRLQIDNPDARLTANGRWQAGGRGGPARMVADFRLDIGSAGELLADLGAPETIRGGKGSLQGQLWWNGSPLALRAGALNGHLTLALQTGEFLKADTRGARLLSLFSLQALPRLLTLDFRDLSGDGFAFDEASADITLADGVARTDNLRLRGLRALVLMSGQADLARETQDLRVVVIPEINAGAASLAYSLVNPAIGLGTFLAQLLMREPMMQAGTREFHVTGDWADPKVERIERAAAAPPSNPVQ
jgi:uncharacterized protein (TIGR02099 family)